MFFRWDNVQNTRLSYTVSRSMSQFKVMGLTFEVGVCYISPEPFESVSLNFTQVFLSVRRCVEAMTQLPRLQKVKVTFQGHGIFTLQFSVWSHRLSSLNIVFFSLKCSPHGDVVQNPWFSYAQSMSSSYLKIMELTLQFYVCSISSEPFERFSLNFSQLFLSVIRCAEPMTQLCSPKVKVTLWCYGILRRVQQCERFQALVVLMSGFTHCE